jgi:hypothetical protein
MCLFLSLFGCASLAVAAVRAAIPVIPGSAEIIPVLAAPNSRLGPLREFTLNLLIRLSVFRAKRRRAAQLEKIPG